MINLSEQEKLQIFAERACYVTDKIVDLSDYQNQKEAKDWLRDELGFLDGRDRRELCDVWENAIADGGNTRLLFTAIKVLQDKY